MTDPRHHEEVARDCRQNRKLVTAGIHYGAAASNWYAAAWILPDELRDGQEFPAISFFRLGYWLQDQFVSALCFRIADSSQRCRNRCQRGILSLEELLIGDELTDYGETAHCGLFYEAIGDLRVVGQLGNEDADYKAAADCYAEVKNDIGWQAEHEFGAALFPVLTIADSVGYDLSYDRRERIRHTSLADRINFKRTATREIVEAVVNDGNWESEVL